MLYLDIGRRERGKTTLAVYMAKQAPARLIFDPRRMVLRAESLRVSTAADLRVVVANDASDEVVYAPIEDDAQAAFEAFSLACKSIIVRDPNRPFAIVVDEASFVNLLTPSFQWVLRCSSRTRVHIIITSHRPMDIPTPVRAIADHWLLFACRQEHDLRVIEQRCSPLVARAVQQLQAREFIHWDDEHGRAIPHRDARTWYVDLSPQFPDSHTGAGLLADGDEVLGSDTRTLL